MPPIKTLLRLLTLVLLIVAGPAFAQSSPEATGTSPSDLIASRLAIVQEHMQRIVQAVPQMPKELAQVATTFRTAAGDRSGWLIALGALLCVAAGAIAEWIFRRATAGMRAHRRALAIHNVSDRLTRIAIDGLLEVIALVIFAVGAVAVLMVLDWPVPIRQAAVPLLMAILGVRLVLVALFLLLRPAEGAERALAAFDLGPAAARFWYGHLGAFVTWFVAGWAVISALRVLGMPGASLQFLAYLLGIGLVIIAVATIWRQPSATTTDDGAPAGKARRWLASVAAIALWMIWAASAMPLFWGLTVAIGLPIAIGVVRRAGRHMMRPVETGDGTPAVTSMSAVLVEQALRAAVIVGGIWLLLWGWDLNVGSLTERETAFARLLRGSLHALIILLLADLAWNLIKAMADNALANAQVLEGADADETRRRARIRTLLPLGRNIAFFALMIMAGLMALSAVGIEIGPLIASAGVVGVALGFGAQTVVRDMISGVFYMLDDAFRVGEYIQSGNYKGVVESFSIRSVKLRHQRGALFTIPFGVLGAVQNMSRDWVIVKDQIGITYDSDVEKARKLIKQIGLDLAKDPNYASNILQPLKMQGIEQFGDYAINIRTKMMTKPGEQFVIRRKANALIKKAFDENGIHFAFPTVQLAGGGNNAGAAAAAAQQVLKPAAGAAH